MTCLENVTNNYVGYLMTYTNIEGMDMNCGLSNHLRVYIYIYSILSINMYISYIYT